MTLILRDGDVRGLVRFPDAVAAVADGVVAAAGADGKPAAVAQRLRVPLPDGWLRIMAGTLPALGVFGYKGLHLVGDGSVRYLCALYCLDTGRPLALIDAKYLTVARTSAAAAAAAARFFGQQLVSVAIIGSGAQARDGLRALASVVTVSAARVFSPTAAHRQRYAEELGAELGLQVEPVPSAVEAADGADMALCVTQTGGAVALRQDDLDGVAYVSSIGSTLPSQRELDEHVIEQAATVVVDVEDALHEAGDLLAARRLDASRVQSLGDYLVAGPRDRSGLVVYKSIGSVEQDLALAASVWRLAETERRGEVIADVEALKTLSRRESR